MANGNGFSKGIKLAWMILAILVALGAYAGSYGALKVIVKSNTETGIENKKNILMLREDTIDRLARIETKLDNLK